MPLSPEVLDTNADGSKNAKDTIRDYVLERAKGLLRGGMSVVDTAYALGFNYPNHFTRALKQRFGVLPSEYQ